jgi:hypothetical protein
LFGGDGVDVVQRGGVVDAELSCDVGDVDPLACVVGLGDECGDLGADLAARDRFRAASQPAKLLGG